MECEIKCVISFILIQAGIKHYITSIISCVMLMLHKLADKVIYTFAELIMLYLFKGECLGSCAVSKYRCR